MAEKAADKSLVVQSQVEDSSFAHLSTHAYSELENSFDTFLEAAKICNVSPNFLANLSFGDLFTDLKPYRSESNALNIVWSSVSKPR